MMTILVHPFGLPLFSESSAVLSFCLLAQFAASFFNTPEVVPVIRYMSIGFVFSGMSITSTSLMRRALDFKSLAFIDNASYFVGYGIFGLTLALLGLGVYSLVAAFLVQTLITFCLAIIKTRHGSAFQGSVVVITNY